MWVSGLGQIEEEGKENAPVKKEKGTRTDPGSDREEKVLSKPTR